MSLKPGTDDQNRQVVRIPKDLAPTKVLIELEGAPGGIVNADVRSIVERIAATAHPAAIVQALDAVSSAERAIARNVTPQLALEVMLFDIRKALSCPS